MSYNPTYLCPFCDNNISYNFFLKHLVNNHRHELFNSNTAFGKANLKKIANASLQPKPMVLELPAKSNLHLQACFGCMSAVKSPKWAVKHFPKCCKKAHEKISELKKELCSGEESVGEESLSITEVSSLSSTLFSSTDSMTDTPSMTSSGNAELEKYYLRTIRHLLFELENAKKTIQCYDEASESFLNSHDLQDFRENVDTLESRTPRTKYNIVEDPEFLAEPDEFPVYTEICNEARLTKY